MKKIIFIITIIVIILNVSVFTQEVRDPNKNDVYVKVYDRQDIPTHSYCNITSTLYSTKYCKTYNILISYDYYWKAFENGKPISSYEFFKIAGYREEAKDEKEFRNVQKKYNLKYKKELEDYAIGGWLLWSVYQISTSLVSAIALSGGNNTVGLVGGLLFAVGLPFIAFPIGASIDANNYDPYDYLYSKHTVYFAQYVDHEYNNR